MTNSITIRLGEFESKGESGYQHIHGDLEIIIGERSIPYMAYLSVNDVCFNEWIRVLVELHRIAKFDKASHKYDEYEQGQPAFLFEVKAGKQIFLSIIASASGEIFDDTDWLEIEFASADFSAEFLRFKETFLKKIAEIAPKQLEYWTAKF